MNGEKRTRCDGNSIDNPWLASRCGAKTRRGSFCMGPAMEIGRCRWHGGHSTGAKTASSMRHGHYGEYGRVLRLIVRDLAARARALR